MLSNHSVIQNISKTSKNCNGYFKFKFFEHAKIRKFFLASSIPPNTFQIKRRLRTTSHNEHDSTDFIHFLYDKSGISSCPVSCFSTVPS